MNCRTVIDRVDEFLDALLAPGDARDLRAHVEQCPACARELRAAEKFRAFLAGSGHDALETAAANRAAARARAEPRKVPVPPARGRRLALRALAAAAVVLAAFAGWSLAPRGGEPVPSLGVGAPAHVARGESRVAAEGRTILVDEDALLASVAGTSGERVRLDAGAALFQVERGREFAVETPQGAATVLGTLFHVEVRSDRSVSVAVLAGVVRFEPKGSQARRTLRAGSLLDVDPEGRQRLVSRPQTNDLEMRVEMQGIELDALRGEVQRLEEALAAARAPAASAEPPVPAAAADSASIPWAELGFAARRLLDAGDTPDDPDAMVPMSVFLANSHALRRVTGGAHPSEWPLHPTILSRSAPSFFAALAPESTPEARTVACAQVAAAGETLSSRLGPDSTPTERLAEKLRFYREFLDATRGQLGVGAAAAVARALQRARDGVHVRVIPVGADPAAEIAREWGRALEFDPEQVVAVGPTVRRYVDAAFAAQQSVLASLGTTEAEPLLFPEFRPWRPRPATPAATTSDEEVLARTLRRIDAKLVLAEPRIEFERGLRQILRPEQTAKGLTSGFFGWGLPTLRSRD